MEPNTIIHATYVYRNKCLNVFVCARGCGWVALLNKYDTFYGKLWENGLCPTKQCWPDRVHVHKPYTISYDL